MGPKSGSNNPVALRTDMANMLPKYKHEHKPTVHLMAKGMAWKASELVLKPSESVLDRDLDMDICRSDEL